MNPIGLWLKCVGAVVLLSAPVVANGYDKEFTGYNSNEWSDPENWDSYGAPSWEDSVYIPYGKACVCAESEVEYRAESIFVEAGATLTIDGVTLGIGNQNLAVNTSAIDGEIRFIGENPVLLFVIQTDGRCELDGSGTITASVGNGYTPGTIIHWHSGEY